MWHIHHSLHLYLRANLNALVMNLTRCPESELFHNLCSFWCLKEIICLEQVYAFCILKNSWSHLNSIGFCFIHLPPSPIQTAMSVGWNPTFPDVKVGFSAQRVESDQIFADCKSINLSRQIHFEQFFHANFKHLYFILPFLFSFCFQISLLVSFCGVS